MTSEKLLARAKMSRRNEHFSCVIVILSLLVVHSSALLPPPDISNITTRIHTSRCDDLSPFLAIVLIMSHAGNAERRRLTRETYPEAEINALGFRRVFVLASLENDTELNMNYNSISQTEIEEENRKFSDVIQFSYTEEYWKLTLKSLLAFKWVADSCGQARYVVKTDDDIFVNYRLLAKNIRGLKAEDNDYLYGIRVFDPKPVRDSNYWRAFVTNDEFPEEKYPDYLYGMFYATSPKTMKLLVETALTVPYLHLEDIFFTGLVAEKAGVKKIGNETLKSTFRPTGNCCKVEDGVVYECEYFMFAQNPPLTKEQAEKQKWHDSYCSFYKCKSYSHYLLATPGISCV